MNLSETGNANISCTSSKGQMCFLNMKISWGIICHFVTLKMLRNPEAGRTRTITNKKNTVQLVPSYINYARDAVCSLVMNYEIVGMYRPPCAKASGTIMMQPFRHPSVNYTQTFITDFYWSSNHAN